MIPSVLENVVGRSSELTAVSDFLTSAATQPSGLVVRGEAGIGKTWLWLAAADQAREQGFRVLSARTGEVESGLAYSAVADLLADIEAAQFEKLPGVQRIAIDRMLLRASEEGPVTDQRVASAAFVSVLSTLATQTPVLLAIDDVQWLDSSSQAVIAFAARRLTGRIGLLLTARTETAGENPASWLHLNRPDGLVAIDMSPLTLGGIHSVIASRIGRSFPRPAMVRIAEVSGGNPFYALELARAVDGNTASSDAALPGTLAELVALRTGHFHGGVDEILLAAGCVADPTVDLLAAATGRTAQQVVDLLEEPENDGIVVITGNKVQFTHPLLARGVYTQAGAARRRRMHRAFADKEAQPERRARHLALAAASADPDTLNALDTAADVANTRGAPAAAAELLELAIRLGGDSPSRRLRAAEHHLTAGDIHRARTLLESTIPELRDGPLRAVAFILLGGAHIYINNLIDAEAVLSQAVEAKSTTPLLQVGACLSLALVQSMSGQHVEALRNAETAVTYAEELAIGVLISRAISMHASIRCGQGFGRDEAALVRAMELEGHDGDAPAPFRASVVNAVTLAWTGELDDALNAMLPVWQRCVDRGADSDMMYVSGHLAMLNVWLGLYADAVDVAEDMMQRAEQLGGEHTVVLARIQRALPAAYLGREEFARAEAQAAITGAMECGAQLMGSWAVVTLGFLEVSRGDYAAALEELAPLLATFDEVPGTEIFSSAYLPDAIEAMIGVGRITEAEPLIAALERNGRQLDRAWMLATGARGRAMWLAAKGDVEAAVGMAHQAMTEHARLKMPFERARTQLLLGQLQRRQRQKQSAATTLGEALATFESLGTPLWAQRTRDELARTNVAPSRDLELTPSEGRVAELAASGMSNRDIAATLFISPKTVEHNLGRIYRKLGIRTRAELGRRIDELES